MPRTWDRSTDWAFPPPADVPEATREPLYDRRTTAPGDHTAPNALGGRPIPSEAGTGLTGGREILGQPPGGGGNDEASGGSTRPPSGSTRPPADDPPDHTRPPASSGQEPYTGPRGDAPPAHRSPDHRYARPTNDYARHNDYGGHARPEHYYYAPYYTRWWVHPYYRYSYSTTAVVIFDYSPAPWDYYWVPPSRAGFIWIGGYSAYGYWNPGYWAPVAQAPRYGYVWVPGFWYQTTYIEGYYRPEQRVDADQDWEWIEGYYLDDGTYIWGYWRPAFAGPQGYVWEPGFYDGETYIDGFWRPEYRADYAWMSAYYDEQGVYRAGYWAPTVDRPGYVWIPGWFDGTAWQAGYWISEGEYDNTDVQNWEAPEGWDGGWKVGEGWGSGEVVDNRTGVVVDETPIEGSGYDDTEEIPLAIPIR